MKTCNYILLAAVIALPGCQQLPPLPATGVQIAEMTVPTKGKHPITIARGNYLGGFILDKGGQIFAPHSTFYLAEGEHSFDVGSVGRSNFTFEVLADGSVAKVSNPKSAHADGKSLVLHTTKVTVEPEPLSEGGNVCEMVAYPKSKFDFVKKRQTFYLVPALTYQFDSGVRLGGSAFIFEVREDGTVWSDHHSATGGPHCLKLNVGWIEVKPFGDGTPETATYRIGAGDSFSGTKRIPVIFGLVTTLRVGDAAVSFLPEYGDAAPRHLNVGGRSFTITVPWDQHH